MEVGAPVDAQVCDSGKGKSRSSRRKITYGSMEDYHVADFKKLDDNEVGLFAIFDSHSGTDVASYLREHLFDNILHEPDFWSGTMKAIRRAYHGTDGKILKRKECDVRRRGSSTAVTVILINGEALVIANVGDSRALISEDGMARQLSVDHEPLKEQHEIESRGGFVTNVRGDVKPRSSGCNQGHKGCSKGCSGAY